MTPCSALLVRQSHAHPIYSSDFQERTKSVYRNRATKLELNCRGMFADCTRPRTIGNGKTRKKL
jgi:hypothetical protein